MCINEKSAVFLNDIHERMLPYKLKTYLLGYESLECTSTIVLPVTCTIQNQDLTLRFADLTLLKFTVINLPVKTFNIVLHFSDLIIKKLNTLFYS